jgi:hypothetical protein
VARREFIEPTHGIMARIIARSPTFRKHTEEGKVEPEDSGTCSFTYQSPVNHEVQLQVRRYRNNGLLGHSFPVLHVIGQHGSGYPTIYHAAPVTTQEALEAVYAHSGAEEAKKFLETEKARKERPKVSKPSVEAPESLHTGEGDFDLKLARSDHWISHSVIPALAKAAYESNGDQTTHNALSDALQEEGDPLHHVVRRSPMYDKWATEWMKRNPGKHVLGEGNGYEGSIKTIGHWPAPELEIRHRVIGAKNQEGGKYHLVSLSTGDPKSTKILSHFVAPVTKAELQEILAFHKPHKIPGALGLGLNRTGRRNARAAIESKASGEHELTKMAREDAEGVSKGSTSHVWTPNEEMHKLISANAWPQVADRMQEEGLEKQGEFLARNHQHIEPWASALLPPLTGVQSEKAIVARVPHHNMMMLYNPKTRFWYRVTEPEEQTPAKLDAASTARSKKIGKLVNEGKPVKQAVAIAYSMQEQDKLARALEYPEAKHWKPAFENPDHAQVFADWLEEHDDPLAHVFREAGKTGTVGVSPPNNSRLIHRGNQASILIHKDEKGEPVIHVVPGEARKQIKSVRGVGSKRGYPYYAMGTYEATPRVNGQGEYWKLKSSGPWGRSMRRSFYGATDEDEDEGRYTDGVRHGTPVTSEGDIGYWPKGVSAPVSLAKLKEILASYPRGTHVQPGAWRPHELPFHKVQTPEQLARVDATRDVLSKSQTVKAILSHKIMQEAGLRLLRSENVTTTGPTARASLVQEIGHDAEPEAVNYAAAWYGMLAKEPHLTVFHEDPQGNSTLHVWKSPLGPDHIVDAADRMGLPGVSVGQDGNVYALSADQKFLPAIRQLQGATNANNTAVHKGNMTSLGGGNESGARAKYREAIQAYERSAA